MRRLETLDRKPTTDPSGLRWCPFANAYVKPDDVQRPLPNGHERINRRHQHATNRCIIPNVERGTGQRMERGWHGKAIGDQLMPPTVERTVLGWRVAWPSGRTELYRFESEAREAAA